MATERLAETIKYIFLSILLVLKLIVFLIIISPLFLWRWIVKNAAKVFKPELYKILNRFNSVFTAQDPELEERNNVILTLKIGGKLNYESLINTISKMVFEVNADGEHVYPEFHLYWEKWLGFAFWKWEKNFRIKNHVSRGPSTLITSAKDPDFDEDEFITNFENSLLKKPFVVETSPWEVVVVEGLVGENEADSSPYCWYLFFKFHHSIGDGYSIFNLLMRCSDSENCSASAIQQIREETVKITIFKKLWNFFTFPFRAAYEIVKLESALMKTNPLRLPISKTLCAEKVIVKSNRIMTEDMRQQSKLNKTTFTASLVSAISLGIQRYLDNQGKDVPEFLLAQFPVPVPNRPEGLTNHFSLVCLKLPTELRISERRRLEICEEEIAHAKISPYKDAMYFMIKLLGSLPTSIQEKVEHIGGSIEIASFPGPRTPLTFQGQPILDMYYNVVCGQFSLDLCILSYNGGIRIVANADPHVFPSDDMLSDLVRHIEEAIGRVTTESSPVSDESISLTISDN